ncbi:MAG: hypothetical protein J3Q66DRAFT_369856 [Benniella sp.]|nr:MAG: hypothetical protein J3Q66DRAFT_369856 [Benniella sp.]
MVSTILVIAVLYLLAGDFQSSPIVAGLRRPHNDTVPGIPQKGAVPGKKKRYGNDIVCCREDADRRSGPCVWYVSVGMYEDEFARGGYCRCYDGYWNMRHPGQGPESACCVAKDLAALIHTQPSKYTLDETGSLQIHFREDSENDDEDIFSDAWGTQSAPGKKTTQENSTTAPCGPDALKQR